MDASLLEKYADVVLNIGIGMREGEKIEVAAESIHQDFIVLLAERAYEQGAAFVRSVVADPRLAKARLMRSQEQHLEYVPGYIPAIKQTHHDEHWSQVFIGGMADPDVMKGVDPKRSSTAGRALGKVMEPFTKSRMDGTCPWTATALPTPGWAAKVLGKPVSDETTRAFEEVFVSILRLDADDPVKAWQEHSATLAKRTEVLGGSRLERLSFTGPGTDLSIHLAEKAKWTGGAQPAHDGREYMPNLPTEEVFTVPHLEKTEGKVRCTRPLKIFGNTVSGASFVFEGGKVVSCDADEGLEQLESFLDFDEGARCLGEVALVDISSPIYQSGLLFDSILFDENACCHIALGRGLAMAIEGGAAMDKDELGAIGCNQSLIHLDFMIGSEELSVVGHDHQGGEREIIRNGGFVI